MGKICALTIRLLSRTGGAMAVLMLFFLAGSAQADLGKAKGTTDNIRQADPPSVSTTTKPSPVGQRATDYHPQGPSVKPQEPPSPVNKLNPRNDRDVQRGLDTYKKPR